MAVPKGYGNLPRGKRTIGGCPAVAACDLAFIVSRRKTMMNGSLRSAWTVIDVGAFEVRYAWNCKTEESNLICEEIDTHWHVHHYKSALFYRLYSTCAFNSKQHCSKLSSISLLIRGIKLNHCCLRGGQRRTSAFLHIQQRLEILVQHLPITTSLSKTHLNVIATVIC